MFWKNIQDRVSTRVEKSNITYDFNYKEEEDTALIDRLRQLALGVLDPVAGGHSSSAAFLYHLRDRLKDNPDQVYDKLTGMVTYGTFPFFPCIPTVLTMSFVNLFSLSFKLDQCCHLVVTQLQLSFSWKCLINIIFASNLSFLSRPLSRRSGSSGNGGSKDPRGRSSGRFCGSPSVLLPPLRQRRHSQNGIQESNEELRCLVSWACCRCCPYITFSSFIPYLRLLTITPEFCLNHSAFKTYPR